MSTPALPKVLLHMGRIARAGGAAIMSYHCSDTVRVEYKEDDSPVTEADKAAHRVIAAQLTALRPRMPVLSEEGGLPEYAERSGWSDYWLVDPLDGTKDFVRRYGDFTVNVAFMRDRQPRFGAIYAPVHDVLLLGGPDMGTFCSRGGDGFDRLHPPLTAPQGGPVVLQSRIRKTPKLDDWLQGKTVSGRIAAGSAWKFCLLAMGEGHVYPCLHPTWEWDTAAGQAIVEGVGGSVTKLDGAPLEYNKEELLNPSFVAVAPAGTKLL